MQKNVNGFSLCGWVLLMSAQAHAQTGQAHVQTGIETLVVTGERFNNSVAGAQVLDASELQPGTRADAAELLQGLNGVQADSRSNYAQDTRITLRGFGARAAFGVRGLDLQVDGIPLSMPDGQGQFSGAVLDGVSQMSVLTGPVAALYGNGAGGVINLKTFAPQSTQIVVDTATDEDGLARHHLVGEYNKGDLSARIQASHLTADGNRPHASAERDQLGAQVYYQFDNGVQAQWRFDKEDAPLLQDPLGLTEAQWLDDPYQLNSSAEFFDTRKIIEHQQNAISLRQEQGDQRWQVALWNGERHIQQYLAQKGDALANSGGVVDLHRDFSGANGNYTWDFTVAARPASFTLGAEWSSMNDSRKGFVNDEGAAGDLRRDERDQASNRDAYALVQWDATKNWQWLIGMRQSHVELSVEDYFVIPDKNADDSGEKKFNHTSEAVSTRYRIDEHFSIHAALGEGFEAPTLTEMAYTNGDKGFNSTLDAATNKQQEIGVDFQHKNITVNLTGFKIVTRDELVVDQSLNGRTTYINATETERKGLEFNGLYKISNQLDLRVAVNYLDAIYTQGQFARLQLPGIAKKNHYAQINWSPLDKSLLKFSLSAVHRDEVATNDNNQIKAPAYLIVKEPTGEITTEKRIWVSIDWTKAPKNKSQTSINVTGSDGSKLEIPVNIDHSTFEAEKMNAFVAESGYISMEAPNYSRAINSRPIFWKTLPNYGKTLGGVIPVPVTSATQTPDAGTPHLEYDIYLNETGSFTLNTFVSPTIDFANAEGLKFAVSIDNEMPVIVNISADYKRDWAWRKSVAESIKIFKTPLNISKAGRHSIKYWMVTPAVVLQKLVLDLGGLKPSFLG
ncbi:MAG: TonB-dependent receptor, partial [Moraxellaceae bacterium]